MIKKETAIHETIMIKALVMNIQEEEDLITKQIILNRKWLKKLLKKKL